MKRRLAGVGEADEADIGEQLQLEPQIEFFAGLAGLQLARRAVGGRCEVRVAKTAASALRDQHALADVGQIGDLLELAGSGSLRKISVPTGTGISRSLPSRPVRSAPSPLPPRCALYSGVNRK